MGCQDAPRLPRRAEHQNGPEQAKKLAKKLVEELTAFRKQKTIQLNEGDPAEDEMISVARSVRRKRGSWYQVPRDLPDPKDDD